MKIWVDDCRPAPKGYKWCKSVFETIETIDFFYQSGFWDGEIEVIDLDHDAGDYYNEGGDYIEILNWMEVMKYNIPIRLHTMNPVGRENMRRIIRNNHWKEVF